MYDGIFYGTLIITVAFCFIGLLSGNFASAATSATILFIIIFAVARKVHRENDEMRKRLEEYKKWCPGKTDEEYRRDIERNRDYEFIAFKKYRQRIEKRIEYLKITQPGRPSFWYQNQAELDVRSQLDIIDQQNNNQP